MLVRDKICTQNIEITVISNTFFQNTSENLTIPYFKYINAFAESNTISKAIFKVNKKISTHSSFMYWR